MKFIKNLLPKVVRDALTDSNAQLEDLHKDGLPQFARLGIGDALGNPGYIIRAYLAAPVDGDGIGFYFKPQDSSATNGYGGRFEIHQATGFDGDGFAWFNTDIKYKGSSVIYQGIEETILVGSSTKLASAEAIKAETNTKEPAFAKNTAFNKNFGSSSETVCEGNDSRLSDARSPTGAASGDLSGTYPSPTVAKVQGYAYATTSPTNGQVPTWNSTASEYQPQTPSSGGLWTDGTGYIYPTDLNDELRLGNGGYTYPSLSFYNDPNSGIYLQSTGVIAFSTGSAYRMKLSSAGLELNYDLTITNGRGIIAGTTVGLKIGTATNQKLGFFGVTPVTQQTEITDELTTITHTNPTTPDYDIQDLTDTGGFGFATKDEGNTVLSVIKNLQDRINDLENRLTNLGLIADAD